MAKHRAGSRTYYSAASTLAQAARQQQRAHAQAARQQQEAYLHALEIQATTLGQEAGRRLAALNGLLLRGLSAGKRFEWDELKANGTYPPFSYPTPAPSYASVAAALHVPRKTFLESMFPSMRTKREAMEAKAQQELTAQVAAYESSRDSARRAYEQQRMAFEHKQSQYNASIDDTKRRYEQGEASAVTWVVRQVLDRLDLPEEYGKQFDVAINTAQSTVAISMWMPKPSLLPRVAGYKLVKVRKAVEPIELKQREYDALYDNVVHQIALLTIHRVFRDCQTSALRSIVFNGMAPRVDPATGKDGDACVLSVQIERSRIQAIDLRRVDARECVKSLGGATSGSLARLTPVRPLMDAKQGGVGKQGPPQPAQGQSPLDAYCGNCGALNRSNATFCSVCGHNLANGAAGPVGGTRTGLLAHSSVLHGRYRIIRQVGKGGMGAVYKASDSQLGDRAVAIKEMSQSGLSASEIADAAKNFKAEAVMLARLSHPSLPKVFDHFEEGNRWYLVMDFIEGQTLESFLSTVTGHELPVKEVLDIGEQLCAALDYLHAQPQPIIFRDLKPSNVMVTAAGTGHLIVHLIDFGIARLFKAGQAADTVAFGSPGYAPPEQYGKTQTTGRSDIYSLGATMHHLLTGTDPANNPFHFTPVRAVHAQIPPELERLIANMVEMDPNNRPSSVKVVRQQLERIRVSLNP